MRQRLLLLLLSLSAFFVDANARTGLLVVAHGSPMPAWNAPVLALEEGVRAELKARGITTFEYVRVALMEYVEPSIATVVADMERAGMDTLFAAPVFMAPSSHTELDIPVLLGQRWNSYIAAELREEGAKPVSTHMPIIVGPTMNFSDLLETVTAERVAAMSADPKVESVLLLAHGDELYEGYWRAAMESIASQVRKQTGIERVGYRFIEMGQDFAADVAPAIAEGVSGGSSLLVQGIYLSSGAASLARRWQFTEQADSIAAAAGGHVTWGPDGILPKSADRVAAWIVEQATEWRRNNAEMSK